MENFKKELINFVKAIMYNTKDKIDQTGLELLYKLSDTPELEEFRVGFEFEYSTINGKIIHIKSSFGSVFNTIGDVKYFLQKERIRVKYLDKDDIEEFGWKSRSKDNRAFVLDNDGDLYGLHVLPLDETGIRVQISEIQHGSDRFVIFSGWIKNKSELKVLMKQLGI